MTLASDRVRVDYRGNGSKTDFPVPFRFLDNEHLAVTLLNTDTNVETVQVLNGDYTVTGANTPTGGTLTMVSAPESDEVLTIIRDVPYDQLIDFRENDPFSANRNEFAYDKLTMLLQQNDEAIRRAVVLKATIDLDEVDPEDLYPDAGGFTQLFPARIDAAAVAPNEGAYDFVEQIVVAGGAWADRGGGISDVAWPTEHCLASWRDDLPLFVYVLVHKDNDGNITYVFRPPPPCDCFE